MIVRFIRKSLITIFLFLVLLKVSGVNLSEVIVEVRQGHNTIQALKNLPNSLNILDQIESVLQ